MKRLMHMIWKLKIWKDTAGQDLIEYALMAGFVAVAAAAFMPGISGYIVTIFTAVRTKLGEAATAAGG